MEEKIKELYRICITDGRPNNCGREKCMDLIIELERKYPNVDFGEVRTGFMNIPNIIKYCENLT